MGLLLSYPGQRAFVPEAGSKMAQEGGQPLVLTHIWPL